ncbi:alpha/beta fold hydrolase [Streptococcus hillyeri]|uniref:Alpha/beta hydrolase n=1 Tax=Streptococcus hillyeri TaxID=2282420 RepID=A0A3L9DY89_9STRE|nr:alpha/beta hydrolase [Streptococcus hillyeri]RLY04867.1 alpha/beta hydrolase [Streptococcus hillyeri]
MTPIYFLDGLGSNRHYVTRLEEALVEQGFELTYLALPGQPDNFDCPIETLEDLTAWFNKQTPNTPFILMGFSLGADFAAYLAKQSSHVSHLILLDGGFMDFDVFGYSLEQELADTKAYFASETFADLGEKLREEEKSADYWGEDLEKAVRHAYVKKENQYQLNLNSEIILNLLKIRRDCQFVISKPDFSVPTLMILSDSPAEFLDFKQTQLSKIKNNHITSKILSNTTHHLYLEKPNQVAVTIKDVVSNFSKTL